MVRKVLEFSNIKVEKGTLNRLKFNLISIHLPFKKDCRIYVSFIAKKQEKAQKSHTNIKVQASSSFMTFSQYSHLSNKRGGGAKNAKSLNVEGVINVNF